MKQCIFGDHLKYNDMFIEKIPEGVVMCFECSKKHDDDTIYKNGGWKIGVYGIGYLKGFADRRCNNPIIKEE